MKTKMKNVLLGFIALVGLFAQSARGATASLQFTTVNRSFLNGNTTLVAGVNDILLTAFQATTDGNRVLNHFYFYSSASSVFTLIDIVSPAGEQLVSGATYLGVAGNTNTGNWISFSANIGRGPSGFANATTSYTVANASYDSFGILVDLDLTFHIVATDGGFPRADTTGRLLYSIPPAAVPEPSAVGLMMIFGALACHRRRR